MGAHVPEGERRGDSEESDQGELCTPQPLGCCLWARVSLLVVGVQPQCIVLYV